MEDLASLDQGRARALAGAFDALVRGVRSRSAHLDTLVARSLAAFADSGDAWLHIDALSLRAGAFRSPETRWTLPVFLAGVRALRSTRDCRADDLLQLAERLASTLPSAEGAESLQDWVYSDGASGFEVSLAPSFVESLEAADAVSLASTSAILALRARAMVDESDSTMAVAELDRAGNMPTLAVSVDLYERRVEARQLELDGRRMRAAAQEAESLRDWLNLELDLGVRASSRDYYPARRLGRLLRARVGLGVDDEFIAAWQGGLARETEADASSGERFSRALHTVEFIQSVGRGATSLEGSMREVIVRLPIELRVDLGTAHLMRNPMPSSRAVAWITDDQACSENLAQRALGEDELLRWVQSLLPSSVDLCKSLLRAASRDCALAVLQHVNDRTLSSVAVELAGSGSCDVVDKALLWLSSIGQDDELIRLLGAKTREPPSAAALHRAMTRLRSANRSSSLVALARDRKVSTPVRRAALEAAYLDKSTRDELLAFRFSEWLDPGEVAYDLRALRARSKREREAP